MHRRLAIRGLAGLGVALAAAARAQPLPRAGPARIAIVDDAPPIARAPFFAAFRRKLAELGYVDGADVVVEYRSADGDLSRLPALVADVVARQPDVLLVVTTTVALAAKQATSTIPIVALGPADPVKSGLVESLGRPGGNLTGVAQNQGGISGKWLGLLRDLAPAARSFAYLTDLGNPGERIVFDELTAAARPLGMSGVALSGTSVPDVERSFRSIEARRIDALIVATTSSLLPQRVQIVSAAARARLPAVYARREYPEAGGLVSYGTPFMVLLPRAVDYVNRILRGARPGDLPFEMIATYELVVNARAARAQGVTIPQAIRVRADEVIE